MAAATRAQGGSERLPPWSGGSSRRARSGLSPLPRVPLPRVIVPRAAGVPSAPLRCSAAVEYGDMEEEGVTPIPPPIPGPPPL